MLVPKLRFKREDGTSYPEWKNTSFGETCSGFEYGMNTASCNFDGVHQYIRITDIDDTSRRYMSENAVSPKGKMQDKYIVNVNDILFARTGASVGKAYLYRECDGLLYYAGFLIRANVNKHNNAYFVFSQTLTSDYWNWVKLTSMRTGQQGINAQEYKEYKFFAPCFEEQQKIADFLSNVDEVISQSEAEVKNLEQQKKAVMQKIFSQEVRFKREDGTDFPEWEEKNFSEFYQQVSEKNDGSFGTDKIISVANMYFKQDVVIGKEDYLKSYNICRLGDIAFEGNKSKKFAFGRLVENDIGDGIVSHVFIVFRPISKYYNLHFWKYLINYEPIMGKLLAKCTKKSTMMTDLVPTDFLKQIIAIPCLEEQQKIADFLSAYDEAITYAKQELDKWKELKKGLLQQMFV